MESVESKAQSQGQESQIMSENVEGFQQCVNEILNLIEQDVNFTEMTPEIYDCKKSKLTKLVTDLSSMCEKLTGQHVRSIKEANQNKPEITAPTKTEHVDSSTTTTPQITQGSKTNKIMTRVAYEFTLDTDGGGFNISLTSPSDSKSESFISIDENLNSPVKDDASKVKETKLHDPKVLRKKISTLEKEKLSLKKKLQDLTDENAILKAEKCNVAELKHLISRSNCMFKKMEKMLEASRQKVFKTEEENVKLHQEMSSKVFDETHRLRKLGYMDKLGLTGKTIDWLEKLYDEEEARNLKLQEEASLGLAEIATRDEQITELNSQINLLKNSHATEEDKWNADIERLKTEITEKCELVDDLNQKHDALKSFTDELKLKLAELEEKWIRREM